MKRVKNITGVILLLIIFQISSYSFIASDPTSNTPNARVIGLGRAYVGLADDSAAIYTNPAGLAQISRWQISTMSGKLLDEFNYLSGNFISPSKLGVFGIGILHTSVDGGDITTIVPGTEADPVYMVDLTGGSISNTSSVLSLSYGSRVDRFIKLFRGWHPAAANLKFGLNLKMFSTSLSGTGLTGSDGSGMDLNVGLLTEPYPWMGFGIAGRNVLPATMGGKLVYSGDHEESYPASLTIGTAINILGEENALRAIGRHKLIFLADYSTMVKQDLPDLIRLGLEWKPIGLLSLRGGIDQSISGEDVDANLCAGIGITYRGFRFDYGYHDFSAAPGISNNYFTLTYTQPEPVKVVVKKVEKKLQLKLVKFDDVPKDNWAFWPISLLATQGIIEGYPDGTFRPLRKIARSELAALLVRIAKVDLLEGKHVFKDVPTKYWAYDYIYTANKNGIVTGYPGNVFKPKSNIIRAEALAMITRFDKTKKLEYKREFQDVSVSYWAAQIIAGAKKAGLIDYIKGDQLMPKQDLTRAEAAEILLRTMTARKLLKEGILKGFEKEFDLHMKGEKVLGTVKESADGKFWEVN